MFWLLGYLILALLAALMMWWFEPYYLRTEGPPRQPYWLLCLLGGLLWPVGVTKLAWGLVRGLRATFWKRRM